MHQAAGGGWGVQEAASACTGGAGGLLKWTAWLRRDGGSLCCASDSSRLQSAKKQPPQRKFSSLSRSLGSVPFAQPRGKEVEVVLLKQLGSIAGMQDLIRSPRALSELSATLGP